MSQVPRKSVRNKDGSRKASSGESQPSLEGAKGANRQPTAALGAGYLLALHKKMGREAFSRLLKTPFASTMNGLMIAIAFTLPALLYLLVINLQLLGGSWDGLPRVSVYLEAKVQSQTTNGLMKKARNSQLFDQVVYISPEQGMKDFQQKAGISSVASELGFNPLPGVIQLTAKADADYQKLNALVVSLEQEAGVDQVRLDRQWVQRLHAILGLLEQIVYTMGVLLSLTILLVISNTIRLNIESRRDEIRIIKMVGGTDGFISLPFIYMGIWYGLSGAILAQVTLLLVMALLSDQIVQLAGLYSTEVDLQGPGITVFFTMVSVGILLGIAGAVVGCYRHLRTLSPV